MELDSHPEQKKPKNTLIEVVGQTKIHAEVADYEITVYLSKTSEGTPLILKEVPILPNLKYNLISDFTWLRRKLRKKNEIRYFFSENTPVDYEIT